MNPFFPLAQGLLELKAIFILMLVFAGPLISMLAGDLSTPRDQEAPSVSDTGALAGTHYFSGVLKYFRLGTFQQRALRSFPWRGLSEPELLSLPDSSFHLSLPLSLTRPFISTSQSIIFQMDRVLFTE